MRFCITALLTLHFCVVNAQTPAPELLTGAPGDVPSTTEPLTPVSALVPQAVVVETCRTVSDKAMAADIKALSAKGKHDVGDQLQLHSTSETLWSQAILLCEGRAKERAERNRAESVKVSAVLKEQLDNGPECAAAHKDASTLQELARAALSERRWADSASLYRKSEDVWDLATERCNGSQKVLAERRREQTEVDGFNAENCAPRFDKAREYTQKLRTTSAGLTREEKQESLMTAETLWREASDQCKGAAAQDSARNNAQALGRERGTPWVAKVAVAPTPPKAEDAIKSKALSGASALGSVISGAFASAATSAPKPEPSTVKAPVAPPIAALTTPLSKPLTPAPVSPPAANPREVTPIDVTVGAMRMQGDFTLDANMTSYSGKGKVSWTNGDRYEGEIQSSKRHGHGVLVWADGNRYDGQWEHDETAGVAAISYANGSRYEGHTLKGVPKGIGKITYASGDSYSGEFEGGALNGAGTYTWSNGQKYVGTLKDNTPNGQGTMYYNNGDRYEGTLLNGVPHQSGTFIWKSGDRYIGQWKNGAKDGLGTLVWSTGDRWEGVYAADAQTANGTMIHKTP